MAKGRTAVGRVLAASVVLAFGMSAVADAVPLPPEDCEKLAQEQGALNGQAIKEQIAQGPAWGKANLSSAQLKEVERYIQLEEQLLFRCGLAKTRSALPVAEEDVVAPPPKPAENGGGQAAEKTPGETPAPKPKPKAARKTPAKPPAEAEAAAKAEPASPAKQPRPKAKAKVDDAFRPEAAAQPPAGTPAPAPVR